MMDTERTMFLQKFSKVGLDHFDSILSPKQCGFCKGHSAQNCLIVTLEQFKESRDRGEEFGALFTDLSKGFNCRDTIY